MSAIATAPVHAPASTLWSERLRLACGATMIFAVLHFLVDATLLERGDGRPVVLLATQSGALAGLATVVLLGVVAWAIGTVMPRRHGAGPLAAFGLALAAWAALGGTVDDWLILQQPAPDGPDGYPYWMLVGDYFALAALTALLVWRFAYDGREHGPDQTPNARRTFGLELKPGELPKGLATLAVVTIVAAVVLYLVGGPQRGWTYRGQVYFGVALACAAGVFAGRSVTGETRAIWFWPAPFIVGLVGLVACGLSPAPPEPLARLDVFPPFGGLCRALPVEMAGVGLVAIVTTQRIMSRTR